MKVIRLDGEGELQMAIAKGATIGHHLWHSAPVALADRGEEFPTGIGWTLFASLEKVVFDFANKRLYLPKSTVSIDLFRSAMSQYGVRVSNLGLVFRDGQIVMASQVKSLFDIPITGTGELLSPAFWSVESHSADSLLRLFSLGKRRSSTRKRAKKQLGTCSQSQGHVHRARTRSALVHRWRCVWFLLKLMDHEA